MPEVNDERGILIHLLRKCYCSLIFNLVLVFRHIGTSNDITIIWLIYRKVLVRFEPNETSLENSFNYKPNQQSMFESINIIFLFTV